VLIGAGMRISMDGHGRWMDNGFIERLWRSLKYEEVYLKGYAAGREAKAGITGGLDSRAVDMPLRLDNAGALATCPPPQ
jgi:transposase InsO family protein